jgi:hypothetical protein
MFAFAAGDNVRIRGVVPPFVVPGLRSISAQWYLGGTTILRLQPPCAMSPVQPTRRRDHGKAFNFNLS